MRDWLRDRNSPTGSQAARLIKLGETTDRLGRVMEPAYIPLWLNRPLETLDDDKPIERLARGDYRSIAKLVAAIEHPAVS